ncbi:hypothetical protein KCU85_g295, partial [Aureobasidium melanogenum]
MSDENPLTTTIDRSIGSRMGARYSLTNVCAPRLVGYMKMSVPLSGDSSTSLSTNNEGPLVVNMSENSFLLKAALQVEEIEGAILGCRHNQSSPPIGGPGVLGAASAVLTGSAWNTLIQQKLAPPEATPLAAMGEFMGPVANCVIASHVILPESSGGEELDLVFSPRATVPTRGIADVAEDKHASAPGHGLEVTSLAAGPRVHLTTQGDAGVPTRREKKNSIPVAETVWQLLLGNSVSLKTLTGVGLLSTPPCGVLRRPIQFKIGVRDRFVLKYFNTTLQACVFHVPQQLTGRCCTRRDRTTLVVVEQAFASVTLLPSGVKYIPAHPSLCFSGLSPWAEGYPRIASCAFSLWVGSSLENSHRYWRFCSSHFRNWPLILVLLATVASVGSRIIIDELSGRILLLESPGAPTDILMRILISHALSSVVWRTLLPLFFFTEPGFTLSSVLTYSAQGAFNHPPQTPRSRGPRVVSASMMRHNTRPSPSKGCDTVQSVRNERN